MELDTVFIAEEEEAPGLVEDEVEAEEVVEEFREFLDTIRPEDFSA